MHLTHRRYVQILDCAKYLTQQSSEMETSKSMVSILSNHKVHSPEISIRVKQVLVNAQQEGSPFHFSYFASCNYHDVDYWLMCPYACLVLSDLYRYVRFL